MEVSYNGWAASKSAAAIGIVPLVYKGRSFPGGVKSGAVHTIFSWLVGQLDARVEPIGIDPIADEWGYNYRANRNANNLSNHSSGTAIDYNATRHPNGVTIARTFTQAQIREIRAIEDSTGGVIRWGGDYTGTPDSMHFEINASDKAVRAFADRLSGGDAVPSAVAPINTEDFLMALSQYQQEETHNAVVDINNRTADMAVAIKGLTDAVNAIAAALKVPDMPFNWLPALNNKLDAITEAVKKEAK